VADSGAEEVARVNRGRQPKKEAEAAVALGRSPRRVATGPTRKKRSTGKRQTRRALARVRDLFSPPYSAEAARIAEKVRHDHFISPDSVRTLEAASSDAKTGEDVKRVVAIFRRLLSSGDSSDAAKNARSPSKVAAECALSWARKNGYSELAQLISAQRGGRKTRRRKRRRRSRSRGEYSFRKNLRRCEKAMGPTTKTKLRACIESRIGRQLTVDERGKLGSARGRVVRRRRRTRRRRRRSGRGRPASRPKGVF